MEIRIDEKALERLVRPQVRDSARRANSAVDQIASNRGKKTNSVLRREVENSMKAEGVVISRSESGRISRAIQRGQKVKFDAK